MDSFLEHYIEAHISAEPDCLRSIERTTNLQRINGRMCAGHIQGRMLKMFTRMISPRRVLELGTFTGYSALCIAEGLPEGGRLVTVEADDELQETILSNFSRSNAGERIELVVGDALEVCRRWGDGEFDMVFIDADKRQYPEYYREAKRLVRPGGYILADNILWDGHVAEADRHDRQTLGVREFNDMVASDPDVEVAIIPVRDGLSIIRRVN